MNTDTILLVHDTADVPKDIVRTLQAIGGVETQHLDEWRAAAHSMQSLIILSCALADPRDVQVLADWAVRSAWKPPVIMIGPQALRPLIARHPSLASLPVLLRPIDLAELTSMAQQSLEMARRRAMVQAQWERTLQDVPQPVSRGILAGDAALRELFAFSQSDVPLDRGVVDAAAVTMVEGVSAARMGHWIEGVRQHHDQTYQHCLLVTGIAVCYGDVLGLMQSDREMLSLVGLLHDVGKAQVPISVLDKPTALDGRELQLIRRHPGAGAARLSETGDIDAKVLAAVRSHHEYLDGSGYPDGLMGQNIGDMVRLLTICDVFGALVERRSYKAPMSGDDAYSVLLGMEGKLDLALVRAFKPVARHFN
jgi:putative nucleotidyltransferase with HDIG domain